MKTKPIALILAAGESSRLAPYAYLNQHKAMIRLLGKPILEHVLQEVKTAGISEVVIVLNPANSDVAGYFGDGRKFGLAISYVSQPAPLGMGSAVLAAREYLTRPFFVLNPNHINAAAFLKSMAEACQPPFEAVLLGREDTALGLYGVCKLNKDRIVGIVEKPAPGKEPSSVRIVGMYLLAPAFLDALAAAPVEQYQFEKALDVYVRRARVRLMQTQRMTYSLKYPWDLFTLADGLFERVKPGVSRKAKVSKTALIDGSVTIEDGGRVGDYAIVRGPCYIGKNAVVGDHALVRDHTALEEGAMIGSHGEAARSIIMEGSHMHSGYIGDSIIGRNCVIGAGFVTANRRLDRGEISVTVKNEKVSTRRTRLGALLGHDVKVGIHSGTMPGVMVGSSSVIGPGTIVFEDVPENGKRAAKFNYV